MERWEQREKDTKRDGGGYVGAGSETGGRKRDGSRETVRKLGAGSDTEIYIVCISYIYMHI